MMPPGPRQHPGKKPQRQRDDGFHIDIDHLQLKAAVRIGGWAENSKARAINQNVAVKSVLRQQGVDFCDGVLPLQIDTQF